MRRDLRTAWLLLLLRDGSNYGYELRRALGARAMSLDPAVMYRTLREMEKACLISSRWVRSDTGPRRRVYDITEAGRAELRRIAAAITTARDAQTTFLVALDEQAPATTAAP